MSRFKMPTAYHPSNAEWVRPIESLTSDGVRELQRLKAENAKLRDDMEDLEGYDQMLRDRLRQETELQVKAEAENAKLRKLVGMMSKAIGVTVDNCRGDCVGPYECTLYGGCPIQKLMRELGVEVE